MDSTAVNDIGNNISLLKNQLSVARNEIHNLRQQIKALGHNHQKEVERIQNALDSWQCSSCRSAENTRPVNDEEGIFLRPIGTISTWFPEKKGTPRQTGICSSSQGKLTIFSSVFTNPQHALEGLEGFSHMWILFHFHKNASCHIRAKVSPPRLNGARTGVFGTRSPHRPSPIGLSLVAIRKIEDDIPTCRFIRNSTDGSSNTHTAGSNLSRDGADSVPIGDTIYFSGVDMVDGTPVLDIKPYIPQYDNPLHCESPTSVPNVRLLDGRESEENQLGLSPRNNGTIDLSPTSAVPRNTESRIGEREAPDGEEGARPLVAPSTSNERASGSPQIRIPSWVSQPLTSKLRVTFSERARVQLDSIERDTESSENLEVSIRSVLQEDPRSVYLRERWGNQFYTFLICNLHVSCKFDDSAHTVTVFQVKSASKMCECGQPEWQCSAHGE